MRYYIFWLLVLGLLTLLFAIPHLMLIFAVFTLGLGYILAVLVVNAFVYALLLLPAVALRNIWGNCISAVFVGVLAFAPGYLGHQEAVPALGEVTASEVSAKRGSATGAEMIDLASGLGNECIKRCERLLKGGQIKKVRIIKNLRAYRNDKKGSSLVFVMSEHGPVLSTDDGQVADISYISGSDRSWVPTRETPSYGARFFKVKSRYRAVIHAGPIGREANGETLYRKASLTYEKPNSPTFLLPADPFRGSSSDGGYEFLWTTVRPSPVTPDAIDDAFKALGIPLGEAAPRTRKKPRERDSEAELPALRAAAKAAFEVTDGDLYDKSQQYRPWLNALSRVKAPTQDDLDLFDAISTSDTNWISFDITKAFSQQAQITELMLERLFLDLEKKGATYDPFLQFVLVRRFNETPFTTEQIEAYRERYLAVVDAALSRETEPETKRETVSIVFGAKAFGIDVAAFTPRLRDLSKYQYQQYRENMCAYPMPERTAFFADALRLIEAGLQARNGRAVNEYTGLLREIWLEGYTAEVVRLLDLPDAKWAKTQREYVTNTEHHYGGCD